MADNLQLYLPVHTDLSNKAPYTRSITPAGTTFTSNFGLRSGSYAFPNSLDRLTVNAYAMGNPNDITISLWIYISGTTATTRRIFTKGTTTAGTAFISLYISSNSNTLVIQFGVSGSSLTFSNNQFFTSNTGKWINLVVSMETATNQVIVYRNGSFFNSGISGTQINAFNGTFIDRIGGYTTANTQIQGNLCELKVFDKILSAAEIKTMYMQDMGMLRCINNC